MVKRTDVKYKLKQNDVRIGKCCIASVEEDVFLRDFYHKNVIVHSTAGIYCFLFCLSPSQAFLSLSITY